MSEHMVRRDWRWRGWFLASFLLGLMAWGYSVARGWRHQRPVKTIIKVAVQHADIMRTGGFLEEVE